MIMQHNGFEVEFESSTIISIDLGDLLEYNTPDWLFCDDHRDEGVEESEDGEFTLPVFECWLDGMERDGCTPDFIAAYRTALELGANHVILY